MLSTLFTVIVIVYNLLNTCHFTCPKALTLQFCISVVLIGQGTPMSGVKGFMIGCTRGVVCIQCYWLHLPRLKPWQPVNNNHDNVGPVE